MTVMFDKTVQTRGLGINERDCMNPHARFVNRLEKARPAVHVARMTSPNLTSSFSLIAFIRRHAALPIIAGVLLAILAPFGTSSFGIAARLLFWLSMSFAGGLGALAARIIMTRWFKSASTGLNVLTMSVGATLAVSPFVLFIFSSQTLLSIVMSLFYVWVISIAISAVGALSDRANKAKTVMPKTDQRPLLMDRLPPKLRSATLYAITSEDHYVRVFTDQGEHLHLMRLSDAEDLSKPARGLKPHRSWWVAEAGVETVTRKEGKLTITLKSGLSVPVSRSGAKVVRESGWI